MNKILLSILLLLPINLNAAFAGSENPASLPMPHEQQSFLGNAKAVASAEDKYRESKLATRKREELESALKSDTSSFVKKYHLTEARDWTCTVPDMAYPVEIGGDNGDQVECYTSIPGRPRWEKFTYTLIFTDPSDYSSGDPDSENAASFSELLQLKGMDQAEMASTRDGDKRNDTTIKKIYSGDTIVFSGWLFDLWSNSAHVAYVRIHKLVKSEQ